MILLPKNWESFQHYKDRNPPWIKLHKSLLDDWDFQRLPDASRALAPMLWLLASEHLDGSIRCSEEELVFRLRMPMEKLVEAIQPLILQGFFSCDSVVLAPRKQDADPEKRREETKTEEKTEKNMIGGSLKSDPKKRRTKVQIIQGFSEEVRRVVNTLGPKWPREGKDGNPTSPTSPQDFCQRVSEILDQGYQADILIQAGEEYISHPQTKYAAPQFFFGKRGFDGGEAKWVGFVKFILTRRENANASA